MPDWIQRIAAGVALVLLSPVLAALAVAIRRDSRGPSLYGGVRVGARGRLFTLWKLRTMTWNPESGGPGISAGRDPRVTRLGGPLRRTRIDELPQLWNVLGGEMRLVGPRPEDPRFVDPTNPAAMEVLTVRPGITGLAQLAFADEGRVLDRDNPEAAYREIVLPRKLLVDIAYVRHRSTALDLRIILSTMLVIAGRPAPATVVDRLVGHDGWRLP